MLKTITIILYLCVIAIFAKPSLDESAAKKFIEKSSDKFLELYIESATSFLALDEFLQSINKRNPSSSDLKTKIVVPFRIVEQIEKAEPNRRQWIALSEETYKFPVDQYTDEEIKIGILKLKTTRIFELESEFKEWEEDHLQITILNQSVCKFKEENFYNCELKYCDIEEILKSTNNEDEILYYWRERREKVAPKAILKMKTFFQIFKKLGEKYGKSAKFAWFRDYLDEDFGENMEKVVTELKPLYKEIHAYMRHILNEQFGNKVSKNGLIPHHMYESAQAQMVKSNSYFGNDFKDIKLRVVNNFNEPAREVIELASNFMKSMGLSELPQEFWSENVKDRGIKGIECAEILYDSGNVTYFRYCSKTDVHRFIQTYSSVAKIYYANERKNLPFAYTQPFNLQYATGEAITLSVISPKYLYKVGHKYSQIESEMEELNRLYRMGVPILLNIPEHFVHVKVISDVLDGTVEFENLNKHYWDLMKKYVGVSQPVERDSEDLDFPLKFYDSIEKNKPASQFFAVVAGFQIHKSLCKANGDYIVGDKRHQLNNCELSNSKEAGKLLKNMMELGAKKSWKKVLGAVTGDENGMNADGLLEYYKPLQEWLHKRNIENGVTIGW